MRPGGFSLVELIVGLAVASMVAAIALVSLSMAGVAAARQLAAVREDDAAWLALAAIARDLHASAEWSGCVGTPGCTRRSAHPSASVLHLEHATWFAGNGLKRCPREGDCGLYLEGIGQAEFFAYVPRPAGGVGRESLTEKNGGDARAVEVVLWTMDGRRYARTVGRARPGR